MFTESGNQESTKSKRKPQAEQIIQQRAEYQNDYTAIMNQIQNYRKTKITFDKGGIWKDLAPPKYRLNKQKTSCTGNCSLHLHSASSKFGPVYSGVNSLGIIIGTGNIGPYLQTKSDQVFTYLSRDGGLTWFEVRFFIFYLKRSKKEAQSMKWETTERSFFWPLIKSLQTRSVILGTKEKPG